MTSTNTPTPRPPERVKDPDKIAAAVIVCTVIAVVCAALVAYSAPQIIGAYRDYSVPLWACLLLSALVLCIVAEGVLIGIGEVLNSLPSASPDEPADHDRRSELSRNPNADDPRLQRAAADYQRVAERQALTLVSRGSVRFQRLGQRWIADGDVAAEDIPADAIFQRLQREGVIETALPAVGDVESRGVTHLPVRVVAAQKPFK